jgi:hypothetical protein
MNYCSVNNGGVRLTGISAAMLVATLAALLAVFALAKPSGAQEQTVTLNPVEVGFGAVQVGVNTETRTVTITNNGESRLVIGGIRFEGPNGTTLDPGTFTSSLDTERLRVGAGDTATFEVSFDPATEGFQEVKGTLLGTTGVTIEGAPQVVVSGTGVNTDPESFPGAGGCDVVGTRRGEVLTGTPDRDVICGRGGADKINGLGDNDVLRGGAGNDRITDKSGLRDKLIGQGGRDRLNAKDGRGGDVLKGGGGKDSVRKDRADRARSI